MYVIKTQVDYKVMNESFFVKKLFLLYPIRKPKMAATIRPDPVNVASPHPISPDAKPELLNKVEGGSEEVHAAILIPGQDGIISISSDR